MKSGIPLIDNAFANGRGAAIRDQDGEYSYEELFKAAENIAGLLLAGERDLKERRVAFLVPSSFDYVLAQWGTWLAGGIAVPLCTAHPRPELEYVIENSEAELIITHPDYLERLQPIAEERSIRLLDISVLRKQDAYRDAETLPQIDPARRAMIVYTSGTTNKPKGVVSTHNNIAAQIKVLVEGWGWTAEDSTLLVLPLHHVHGIVGILSSALWSGATCDMLSKFDPKEIWERFKSRGYTLFLAVPTIYVKLAQVWDAAPEGERKKLSEACGRMRLMVSGSAALPVSVLEKWRAMVGHTFLERYGMTEIGLVISNPLKGERRPGYIGRPFPGIDVRLVDESGQVIPGEGQSGEIQVKGPNVFMEYWKNPKVTTESFKDGWFCTGDTAILENDYYRILGRNSVDIIKSGGYKISALEIEEELRKHPAVAECSVVGIEHEEWGEQVSAAVILKPEQSLTLADLRSWSKDKLAAYKIPGAMVLIEELPRNVMGKVTKLDVKKLF